MVLLVILGFVGFLTLFGLGLKWDGNKGIISFLFSLICLAATIVSTIYYDQRHLTTYNIVKTSVYYGEGESINRVWLESDGRYFWIEIPCKRRYFPNGIVLHV